MNVRYTSRAVRQLLSIHQYIAEKCPTAADRVGSNIERTIDLLRDFPYSGRPGIRPRTRESRVPNLPYVVVYRLESDGSLLILGVYHTAQRRRGQQFR